MSISQLIKAKPDKDWEQFKKKEFCQKLLENDLIRSDYPYRSDLLNALKCAKIGTDNSIIWLETSSLSIPNVERSAILERYFEIIEVKRVDSEPEAWESIRGLSFVCPDLCSVS